MFPVYKYLDSYPQPTHQRNHPTQYPHLYPGWGGVPPYAKLESPIPPVNYEPWPYPSSTECHGCCSHGYPSGFYNYRPPHSHLPPHPPIYFHGAYPPYPDSHPAYFIPPSPYSTGQPQYEYDKNIPRYHFGGCSNHSHFPKNESSVKIEEQKPEIENKKDASSGPINFLNHPYPVVWFPPGYTKDRESSVKIEEHEHKPENDNKKDDSSSSINFPSYPYPVVWFPPGFKNGEINKETEVEPKFQNGWVPLEMHGNRLLKNGGEEKKNQQNGEVKKTQFPLPIFWMPGYDRPEEAQNNDLKEIDVDSGAAKDPPKLKIIPLKLLEKDNHEDKQGEVKVPGNEEKIEAAAPQNKENLVVAEKERKIRSIPVKQIEEIEKRTDENGTKKPSSPVKTSKLPPVCLRVDPMPGKKTKVSKSRSPSPPGEKERSPRQAHVVDSKLPKQVAEDNEGLGKRDTKVVEVDKKTTNTGKEDKEDESAAKVLVQVPVGSTNDVSEKTVEERENQIPASPSKDNSGKTATEEEDKGVTAKEDHRVAEATKGQGEEVKKKSFTVEEAAVLIQSAYHGFEVRRFEPLKKLKQIARVRDQAHDIRERICSLEASAEHRKDEKQILVISEAIMGLLLQLDTIQGLHPSVREVRKAVARELVCLQEKLDSLSGLPDEETKSTVVEDLTDNSAEDGNQTARDCSSVPEGLIHKTEELAEPPLVRDEKLDSKVEVFAELPMLEDGNSHSSSEESAELSVMNVETSDPKMEEPVSSLVKVEVPLLEDEKTEPELEELSLPSLVKTESEFEPMEKVDQDSKPDDFLHPTLVKDGIVEKPESQPGESVEAKSKAEESMVELANSLVKDEEPKSKMVDSIELTLLEDEKAEPDFVELSPPSSVKAETEFEPVEEVETEPKSDELLQTLKDEILEETDSLPEEFGEPKSKNEESMEPESELEQPSLGRGENSGESEPNLESEMGGGTIPGSLISVAVGEIIETGSNTESMNAIVGDEETETKETEETEPGKSATDGFVEEIESVSTKAANEPNVLENVSTRSILENRSTEAKFATEFTAQTHEEILPPSVEATESAENRSLMEVESTLVDGEAVSENTRENRGIDLEVAEELGSTETIEGDLEVKKKWAGKLEEQNEKLREMVEMLLEAGKKQLNVITDLGDRVRDLEKKLSKKKQKGRRQKMKGSSCSRAGNNLVRESSGSTALS